MNRLFIRDSLGVLLAISAITTLALYLGRGSTDRPAPVTSNESATPSPRRSLVALGAELYEKKGCVACHTVDGTPRVGPSFLHDFGSTATLADGTTITVDEAYVRESILAPRAKARPGYPPAMPEFRGLIKDREVSALVAYVESLR